ncbi:MAG: NUDIX hydrolase [Acidimicrobiia bacterium]
MTGRYRMWTGSESVEIHVPVSGSENVMVPVIRGVVRSVDDPSLILLQRRADPAEPVFGCLEIPGGRWRSGESPADALAREVYEETGIALSSIDGVSVDAIDARRVLASLHPLVVVAGVSGAFPAIHVVLLADGIGSPRGRQGESDEVRWWSFIDVRTAVEEQPSAFVPSSRAALEAYIEVVGSAAS